MAQYCRYCHYLTNEMNGLYCPVTDRYITTKAARHTNTCHEYKLNRVDALRQNVKGYNPTGVKPVELGGLGKQIRMADVLKEDYQCTSASIAANTP